MKQIAKRLFELVLFLFLLSFISFVFMKAAPGDPVKQMLRVDDVAVTDEQIEAFERSSVWTNRFIFNIGTGSSAFSNLIWENPIQHTNPSSTSSAGNSRRHCF